MNPIRYRIFPHKEPLGTTLVDLQATLRCADRESAEWLVHELTLALEHLLLIAEETGRLATHYTQRQEPDPFADLRITNAYPPSE